MAARAIWKGVINLGEERVPVKLYSAVEDRSVHFRLLHRDDLQPVTQAMVNSRTGDPVERGDIRRAFRTDGGEFVILDDAELDALEPKPSRDIDVLKVMKPAIIDHRWYERAYYLGPDGDEAAYFALARALERSGREALLHWVMRGKEQFGAMRVHAGYLVLVTLRPAEEVVPAESLRPPGGKPLVERELKLARQLIGMLATDFDPAAYRDEYRDRVLELVARKASGERVKVVPLKPRKRTLGIGQALEESLKQAKRA